MAGPKPVPPRKIFRTRGLRRTEMPLLAGLSGLSKMRGKRLFITESSPAATPESQFAGRLLRALSGRTRLYGFVRFQILPEQFLLCIDQHLPDSGLVLDLGCGFGLFTLWFAQRRPGCHFVGIDTSEHRIRSARRLAETLEIRNITFECQDVTAYEIGCSPSAAYCIDLLHHVSPSTADQLLGRLFEGLGTNGKLIIKDITTRPRAMLYFTFILDCLVSPKDRFYYRDEVVWSSLLSKTGFQTLCCYPLRNFLPYPHFLLVGSKPPSDSL